MDKKYGTLQEQKDRMVAEHGDGHGNAQTKNENGDENYGPMFRFVL